jgi:hypothetical protein
MDIFVDAHFLSLVFLRYNFKIDYFCSKISALLKGMIRLVKIGLRVVPLPSLQRVCLFWSICKICCKILILFLIFQFFKGFQVPNRVFKSFKILGGQLIWNFLTIGRQTLFLVRNQPKCSKRRSSNPFGRTLIVL